MREFVTPDPLIEANEETRQITVRLLTWGEVSAAGDAFDAGSFGEVDPAQVVLRQDHADPALGRGVSYADDGIAPTMTFQLDGSSRATDLLQAIKDGTYRGVSVGVDPVQTKGRTVNGRHVTAYARAALREVSATWRPAFLSAAVLATHSQEEPVVDNDTPAVEATAAPPDLTAINDRLAALEEFSRKEAVNVPEPKDYDAKSQPRSVKLHTSMLADPEIRRALDDIVTGDVPSLVPDATSSELIGIIDATRPFLSSTRRLRTPESGMNLVVPRIVSRPSVGEQMTEKSEVTSDPMETDAVEFPFRTFAGANDLSIQLIKRSSPSFVELFLELLGEDYAEKTENAAVDALLAHADINPGATAFEPLNGDMKFGEAFINAQAVSRRLFPDTLWVSTLAVAHMIDAVDSGTNRPLYSGLALDANANGGVRGTVSGLRVVHVPALDDEAVAAIVGPSRGFAWAEDGTYTLSADVPSKAGRDVGIVGMIAFAPWYPAAFTTYTLTS
jgi:HK97 family phage major capsid protein